MRPDVVEADRRFAVRRAAAGWQHAGAVTPEARREIDTLYDDDRVRTGGWFRVLLFVFTWVAAAGAFGLLELVLAAHEWPAGVWTVVLLLLAAAAAVVTEHLQGARRLRRFGVEEATGWMAVGCGVGAAVALTSGVLDAGERTTVVVLGAALAAAGAASALRWGLPLAGAAAAAGLFAACVPLPGGRWWWIVLALPLAWAAERVAESPAAAPSHRVRAREAWWVALAALYMAVHVATAVDVLGGDLAPAIASRGGDVLPEAAAWAAMLLLPALLIASGLATRRRPRLDAGLLALAATAATAVAELAPRPLWPVLLGAGLLVVGLALLLRRAFRRAPGGALRGWTAEPLFDDADRAAALELAGVATALSPAAREQPDEAGFEGRGGEFGGGGASTGY